MRTDAQRVRDAKRWVRVARCLAAFNVSVGAYSLAVFLLGGWWLNLVGAVANAGLFYFNVGTRRHRYNLRVARGEDVPLSQHWLPSLRKLGRRMEAYEQQLKAAPWQ